MINVQCSMINFQAFLPSDFPLFIWAIFWLETNMDIVIAQILHKTRFSPFFQFMIFRNFITDPIMLFTFFLDKKSNKKVKAIP